MLASHLGSISAYKHSISVTKITMCRC